MKVLAGSVRGKGVGRREYGSPTSRKQIEDKTRTSRSWGWLMGKGKWLASQCGIKHVVSLEYMSGAVIQSFPNATQSSD